MQKLAPHALGIAGELRVMSELMLRGYNPAKSYLDNGIDIFLDNGKKVQVKTSLRKIDNHRSICYRLNLQIGGKGNRRVALENKFDFLIGFLPLEDSFYIIPSKELGERTSLNILLNGKFAQYKNNWEILGGKYGSIRSGSQ